MFCTVVTADYGHLGIPNCIISKWLHATNILAQSRINFQYTVIFMFMLKFSNSLWLPSWMVHFHTFEIVQFMDHSQQTDQITVMISRDTGI